MRTGALAKGVGGLTPIGKLAAEKLAHPGDNDHCEKKLDLLYASVPFGLSF